VRVVLDTSVLVAAVRSAKGASNALLRAALNHQVQILISTALTLEYEAVLLRPEHLHAGANSPEGMMNLLNALCEKGEKVRIFWQWRPQLLDSNDEMVLETAINGRANAICTFNEADFRNAAQRFGLRILSPGQVLMEMRKL